MSLNQQQEQSLVAFVTALSHQEKSLPASVQAQLHAIGQNLESRVVELPVIAASVPSLQSAYQNALSQPKGVTQGATPVSNTDSDYHQKILEHAAHIFVNADPIQEAKKSQSRSLGTVASNPLKRLFRRG